MDYLTFENSVSNASRLLLPYRTKVSSLEKINTFIMIFGFILAVIGAVVLGTVYTWISALLLGIAYVIIIGIVYFITKNLQNKYLRQSHFLLSVFCRSENNRYYLGRQVEMRPGFLAFWLEFITHRPPQGVE